MLFFVCFCFCSCCLSEEASETKEDSSKVLRFQTLYDSDWILLLFTPSILIESVLGFAYNDNENRKKTMKLPYLRSFYFTTLSSVYWSFILTITLFFICYNVIWNERFKTLMATLYLIIWMEMKFLIPIRRGKKFKNRKYCPLLQNNMIHSCKTYEYKLVRWLC